MHILPMLLFASLAGTLKASDQDQYSITALPEGAVANGINDRGQIVGTTMVSGQPRAFTFFNGNLHALGTLPGRNASYGFGINDHGQVCGGSATFGSSLFFGHAFLATGNNMQDLGILPGGEGSTAYAVNNAGEVAGTAVAHDSLRNAFLYNGQMQSIATGSSIASGINEKGELCFYTGDGIVFGYMWSKGKITAIPSATDSETEAFAINRSGHVVGYTQSYKDRISHAFVYFKGQVTLLDTSTTSTIAKAINASGEVVGYTFPAGSDNTTACLFKDGKIIDLNSFVRKNSDWVLTTTTGINDHGQIVGSGTKNGLPRSFLMTPLR
jgi:probable HAF family extracellular repeat protein